MILSQFHFIRPFWLIALIPSILLWIYISRKKDPSQIWRGVIAAHLIPHLVIDATSSTRFKPHHLLFAIMALVSVALSGPSWRQEPPPFANDEAALVVCMKISASMQAQDIQPTRLARAKQKLSDLLNRREGSSTALIAYAGSAHLVLPLTEDTELLNTFANELDPSIMPHEGDAAAQAIQIAHTQLSKSGQAGSVLLITDSVSEAAINRIKKARTPNGPQVHIFGVSISPAEQNRLSQAAAASRGSIVFISADDKDIDQLSRIIETQFRAARSAESGQRWKDSGYMLTPLIALLMLPFFRKGWEVLYE